MAYGIIIFFVISTLIDIIYLTVEPIALILRRENNKPIGVSREAVKAEKACDESSGIKNVLLLYGKYRLLLMCVVCFIILYLIRGDIFKLVGNVIDLFSGF